MYLILPMMPSTGTPEPGGMELVSGTTIPANGISKKRGSRI
jgi:hypothetical protein